MERPIGRPSRRVVGRRSEGLSFRLHARTTRGGGSVGEGAALSPGHATPNLTMNTDAGDARGGVLRVLGGGSAVVGFEALAEVVRVADVERSVEADEHVDEDHRSLGRRDGGSVEDEEPFDSLRSLRTFDSR